MLSLQIVHHLCEETTLGLCLGADAIAMKELTPEYVVGILGVRGSGKSFTFNLMKQRLIEIQKLPCGPKNNVTPYAGHIYLVEFSSWTCAKGNLWASIMCSILTDLNQQVYMETKLKEYFKKKAEKAEDTFYESIFFNRMSMIEIFEKTKKREREYLQNLLNTDADDSVLDELMTWQGNVTDALAQIAVKSYDKETSKLKEKNAQLQKTLQENHLQILGNNVAKYLLQEEDSLAKHILQEASKKVEKSKTTIIEALKNEGIRNEKFDLKERFEECKEEIKKKKNLIFEK